MPKCPKCGVTWKENHSRASSRMLSDAPMEEVIEGVPTGIATLKYFATFQCDHPDTCCPDSLCNSCWTREWAKELLDQRDLLKSGRGVGGKPVFKQGTKDYTKELEDGVLARLETCIQRMKELLAHRLDVEATHTYLERVWEEGCKKARAERKVLKAEPFKPIRGRMQDCAVLDDASHWPHSDMQKAYDTMYGVDPAKVVAEPVAAEPAEHTDEKPKVFTAWYHVDRNTGKFTPITHMGCSACGRPLSEHREDKDGNLLCPVGEEGKTE